MEVTNSTEGGGDETAKPRENGQTTSGKEKLHKSVRKAEDDKWGGGRQGDRKDITAGTVHAAVHQLVSHLYKGSKERDNSRDSACGST